MARTKARTVRVLFAFYGVLASTEGHATPTKQACADAATRGQVYRDDGKLQSALEAFQLCSDPACPEVVRKTCLEWLEATRPRLPSVRVIVAGEHGAPLEGLTLRLDDRPIVEGAPVSVDVGQHTLRVEATSRPAVVQAITLSEGERRDVSVSVPPPMAAAERAPERSRPVPPAFFVASGVAALGIASFAGFGLSAQSQTDRLKRECAPACSAEERDNAFRSALVADISLGIAVVALGAAGYFFFTRPERVTTALRFRPGVSF